MHGLLLLLYNECMFESQLFVLFLSFRALSMIYKALEARQHNEELTIHVSYMEIYQEVGYDLLNTAARSNSVVTPFPKVYIRNKCKKLGTIEQFYQLSNIDMATSSLQWFL